MDRLGQFALLLGLVLAVYGLVASAVGARKERPLLVESARTTAYALLGVVAAANGAMLAAILANDFSIKYVAENSSRATPTFFKVLSLWSADEGSLLLWNLILAGFISAVAFRFRKRRPETLPAAMAVLFAVQCFYLVLVLGPTRPFATLATPPLDGQGPLPLLQNHPLMAAHPPFLYLGFIGRHPADQRAGVRLLEPHLHRRRRQRPLRRAARESVSRPRSTGSKRRSRSRQIAVRRAKTVLHPCTH